MKEQTFQVKTAIVTGGAKGLGKAISLALAEGGAAVIVADVDKTTGEQTVQEISSKGGKAVFILCDLRKESDIEAMVKNVVASFRTVDILANNAGLGKVAPLWETTAEIWDNTMAVNLRGSFLCIRHVIPHMINQKSGRVINISSAVGRQAQPLMAAYAISKAGQIAMTVALAKEVAAFGINVNAVCPGPVETTWWDDNRESLAKAFNVGEGEVVNWFTQGKQLIKTPLTPEDIAKVVYWLSSEETRMITGQAISICGGHDFPTY
jgi:NAD(P)-dependent dehydrogenase (short-subunit alcohol dehydrogenase family)